MAYRKDNAAVVKGQFKAKTGLDLTDDEYRQYTRRANRASLPFAIPAVIFGVITIFTFMNMVGVFNSNLPSNILVGIFVLFVILTCAPTIGAGVMQSYVMKKFAEEIRARRQQQAAVESQRMAEVEQQRQVELARQHQIEQKQRAAMETTRMEKLKKLVKVSEKLKISQMAQILAMNETDLYDRIVDWAADYGFTIDEDVVKFGGGRKDDFIAALDGAFQSWDKKVETKEGKLE
ncbi:MAG TPA: hypothetical protein VKM55_22500 [Candidatus Lokiarchaeia archaeon]|nr:hypothetical protein [Candidatus Lokiarchaeia archaeon]